MIQFKKVLVLYVGGTIGMKQNDHGVYVPVSNAFIEKIKTSELHNEHLAEQLRNPLLPNEMILPAINPDAVVYRIEEYDPLLDSSNMATKEWIKIAKDIEEHYNEFDGFVVLHGTDTLAFTASVLSFMLEDLQKPVVVTGSQISIFEIRNDAMNNFLNSLIVAGCYDIPEVCVFFATKLLRGNRTTKISSNMLNAFITPNFPSLAEVGTEISVHENCIRKPSTSNSFAVNTSLNRNVGMLTCFPTITHQQLESFLQPPMEGLVLKTYGAGNIPANRIKLLEVMKRAIDRGVFIVNITQCAKGPISSSYETGKVLEKIGIIPGYDMTSEAALTKLIYVLGQPGDYAEKVQMMNSDLRGELTKVH